MLNFTIQHHDILSKLLGSVLLFSSRVFCDFLFDAHFFCYFNQSRQICCYVLVGDILNDYGWTCQCLSMRIILWRYATSDPPIDILANQGPSGCPETRTQMQSTLQAVHASVITSHHLVNDAQIKRSENLFPTVQTIGIL